MAKKPTRKPAKKRPATRKKPTKKPGFIPRLLFTRKNLGRLLSLGFTLLIAGLMILLYLAHDLPSVENLNQYKRKPAIRLLATDGELIRSYGHVYGEYISYKDLPKPLINAVLATEDRKFFEHAGVDPWGIARAMVANLRAGRVVQGGSTITQQLAKNIFLTPARNIKRKLQEMLMAFRLENRYRKEDILSIYLNRMYFGAGTYGVDAASKRYFSKPATRLTLPEAAMLAGLLKAPSRYAPSSAPARAQARAKQVLVNMQNADMLDKKELRQASAKLNKIINIKQTGSRHGVMYFTDWLVEELPNYVGKIEEDINVITTLNPRYQAIAEKQVEKYLAAHGKELNISQGALLSMSPGGAIRAMVGGRSYLKSQFNRTLQAKRQPGSAFKLFVYLAGLQAGLEPDSVMEDKSITVQTRQGEWQPTNYNDEFQGFMTLSEAMAKSINTVAVQVAEQVGLQTITAMAKRLGVATPVLAIPSIALGTEEITMLELTTGYAHLANNGYGVIPHGIQEIRTPSGKLLYRFQPSSWQAIDSAHVGHMNRMLQDAVTHGTGRAARLDRPVAGKTGTSQDFRDAWFVGYTPELVTSVWVGNDNAKPMKDVTGGTAPAIIWKNYMKNALAGTSAKKLPTSKSGDLPWGGDSFWERLFGN